MDFKLSPSLTSLLGIPAKVIIEASAPFKQITNTTSLVVAECYASHNWYQLCMQSKQIASGFLRPCLKKNATQMEKNIINDEGERYKLLLRCIS